MRALRDWAPGEQLALVRRQDQHALAVADEMRFEAPPPSPPAVTELPDHVVLPREQYLRLVRAVARSVAEETEP